MFSSSEFIGSDYFPNQSPEQNQTSCGLARYKSAPSSFLAALLESNNTDNSSSGDESEAFFSSILSGPTRDLNQLKSSGDNNNNNDSWQYHHHHHNMMIKQEESERRPPGPVNGQMGYETAVSGGGGCIVGSYSVGMDSQVNNNNNNEDGDGASLVRQSSSPAGFFNGFGVMGDVGNYTTVQNQPKSNDNGITSNHISFSSAPPSSSTRFMPTIPENANNNPKNKQLINGNNNNANARDFEPVFPHGTWNEPSFSNRLKRTRDNGMFSDFNNGESRKNSSGLVHHLSLPKTSSSEMAKVENLLQFRPETTTPCQVRAKRGCATHPRSIAERIRRTRISEKMKKLQDLFPNMDKQTSNADMLDMAVDYIKDLQKQVQTLADAKAKCICSNEHQQT